MNEILILYILSKNQTTMYGLSKYINKNFGSITKPGFGTLQPALKKLESKKFIFSSKFYTDGGKPYFYYSVTQEGLSYLKDKLLKDNSSNPIQFLPMIKIKLSCSDFLDCSDQINMFRMIKSKLLKLKSEAENSLTDNVIQNGCYSVVLNNVVCEYKNLITLVEGFERACNS